MRPHHTAIRSILALGLAALLCSPLAQSASARPRPPVAHAASSYMTGIGDENASMFSNPLYAQLHTKIVRYIAPYDAVTHTPSRNLAITFIRAAEAAHEKVLVSFYHSEYTPTRLPSVATYQHDVQKFVRLFPHVKQYQSWDESNRGNIYHVLSSPSAEGAARYYQALIRVCHGCTVLGLDVLDAANIGPTLEYISAFKSEIGRLRTVMPKIWGLHNYSDINRMQSWRTKALVSALGGQVWLTETGGLVQFGGAYPESQRRGPHAGGEGHPLHVRRRRLAAEDQAALHLQLDRRQQPYALRRRSDERAQPAARRLPSRLPSAARREMQRARSAQLGDCARR